MNSSILLFVSQYFSGHEARVNCLALASAAKRLLSADENGNLVCWDLTARRMETPAWKNADNCELCDAPFFWNFRVMWDRKVMYLRFANNVQVVGQRQHHCRTCGSAVCAACCSHTTKYPPMGFELPVKVCKACRARIDQFPEQFEYVRILGRRFSMTPLATTSELRVGVTSMCVEELRGRMATVGYNRVVMIWDTRPMFAGSTSSRSSTSSSQPGPSTRR